MVRQKRDAIVPKGVEVMSVLEVQSFFTVKKDCIFPIAKHYGESNLKILLSRNLSTVSGIKQ